MDSIDTLQKAINYLEKNMAESKCNNSNGAAFIRIGNSYYKEESKDFVENIKSLFKAAQEYGTSQKTLRHAITSLTTVTEVKNVSISNCNFEGPLNG